MNLRLFPFAENVGVTRGGAGLFGGDMILTSQQEAEDQQRGSITTRRWPNGVVIYDLESSICKYSIFIYM